MSAASILNVASLASKTKEKKYVDVKVFFQNMKKTDW